MTRIALLFFALILTVMTTSCQRCYTCRGWIETTFEGIDRDDTLTFQAFEWCDGPLKAKLRLEAYEAEGYECWKD